MNERGVVVDPQEVQTAIARYYDADTQHEWERATRHPTEFAVTRRALAQHLPPPPARVLDCGGGPGRYAIELAQQGYQVTLFDLSPGNLALARSNVAEAGVTLTAIEQGTATDLSRFADDSFDAVLLMGPLYHLLTEAERRQAIAEARRVLKPGGPLFAAFIARYAAHSDAATKFLLEPVERPGLYERIEETGLLPPGENEGFAAYFARAEEAAGLCWDAGLEVRALLNVEGLVAGKEHYGLNQLTGAAWAWWEELNWRLAAEPSLLAAAQHYLVVSVKPRWRRLLADIVRQCRAAGIRVRAVGGTALALHGLPIPVKDIDLDLDTAGIYRFGELFADHTVQPVGRSENVPYRSHFGRFDFDGLVVEVMSDLEWREGDSWRPIVNVTEMDIELEGVPVTVPWLEEEMLAYVRRGKLERAAQALRCCDQARLLALLRGDVKTGVV